MIVFNMFSCRQQPRKFKKWRNSRAAARAQEWASFNSSEAQCPLLRTAGVIITHREGKQMYCSLAIPELKQACQLIRKVLRAQIRSGQQLAV